MSNAVSSKLSDDLVAISRKARKANAVLPGIGLPFANSHVDKRYKELEDQYDTKVLTLAAALQGWTEATGEARAVYTQELARAEYIERKAATLVAAIGVASGVASALGVGGILLPRDLSTDGQLVVGLTL